MNLPRKYLEGVANATIRPTWQDSKEMAREILKLRGEPTQMALEEIANYTKWASQS